MCYMREFNELHSFQKWSLKSGVTHWQKDLGSQFLLPEGFRSFCRSACYSQWSTGSNFHYQPYHQLCLCHANHPFFHPDWPALPPFPPLGGWRWGQPDKWWGGGGDLFRSWSQPSSEKSPWGTRRSQWNGHFCSDSRRGKFQFERWNW